MATLVQRVPFGTATFDPIKTVHFLGQEQCFEVEFESGDLHQMVNNELRRANGLKAECRDVEAIWLDAETRAGFFVKYADGSEAEASWELVKELPPKKR